ncbi:MAG: TAXI family TRAP transporter solute-binding subunit [Candidatus Nezhaarchaeales archaeon]
MPYPISKTVAIVVAVVVVIAIVAAAVFTMMPTAPPAPGAPPAKKVWRWGTADPASYGYKVSAFLVDFIRRNLTRYDITVYPFVSTTANIKAYCKGELESVYIADLGFYELYTFTGAFEGFKPEVKKMPLQSFWTYTMETFILIPAGRAGEIKSWSDLRGKPVFLTPAGYMNHLNIRRALKALGVEVQHVEVDTKLVSKALEDGTIVATALYTTATLSLPTWGKELDIAYGDKLIPLNPTPEEVEKLKKAGLSVVDITVDKAFTKMKMKPLYGIPFFFGYHVGSEIPEEDVYMMLKVLEKNKDALTALEAGFAPLAKDFAGFQVAGIQSCDPSLVPIHPGLAKYLKEKGVWKAEWDKYVAR